MRIAIVIGSLGYGGAERFCVDMANALTQKGCYVTLISLSNNVPLRHKLNDSVKLVCLNRHRILKFLDIIMLSNLFIRNHIQVVDTHLFASNIYGRIAAFLARVPVIVTHEHTLTPWKKWYHRILELILSRITDKIICISKIVALNRIQAEKISTSKIVLIPIGIDMKMLNFSKSVDDYTIGFIGRFVPAKNIPMLIEVYHHVQRKLPYVKLLLIGDGPMRSHIEKLIHLKRLNDKVVITGFVNSVEKYIEKISVLVLTSIREGTPVSVLEAMAAGIPPVTVQVGALPEIIKDGENGFLVRPYDIERMSDLIVKLLTDERLRSKLGMNARKTALKYDITKIADETVKLYESILRKKQM
jgi:glycosyltransferase involved in cell wall biosynthesis